MGFELLEVASVGALSFALGAFLCRRKKPARLAFRKSPKIWPLRARSILNSQELEAWLWLSTAFPELFIAVKMPLTRFTLPLPGENSKDLYRLLGGVYCTFAICRANGHVVACVDIPGPRGINDSNRELKSALLGQCGIRYEVLFPAALPPLQELRALLLGQPAAKAPGAGRPEVSDAQRRLRKSITQRRSGRPAASQADDSSFMPSEWQQADSFVAPLDSRIAELA